MPYKFSKFKSEVNLLLRASTSISTISTTLNKPPTSIYNAISRIKKKRKSPIIERARKGGLEGLSPREKRIINRDLLRSPKKVNKRILIENDLKITKRSL